MKSFKQYYLKEKSFDPYEFVRSNLKKTVVYFDSFDEFKKNFLVDVNHGFWWHFTDDPDFEISGEKGPRDMSSMNPQPGQVTEKGALMVTGDFDYWNSYYNEDEYDKGKPGRDYAVLLDLSELDPDEIKQVDRGFGNEVFLSPDKASKTRVMGVYPVSKAEKLDQELQEAVPKSEEQLKELYREAWREYR